MEHFSGTTCLQNAEYYRTDKVLFEHCDMRNQLRIMNWEFL